MASQSAKIGSGRCSVAITLRVTTTLVVAGALGIGIGCQQSEVLGPVQGQVRFQGVPVKSGVVTFENVERGVHMTAQLNENGEYRVSMAKGFGLPLGEYRVAVKPQVTELATAANPTPWKGAGKDIPQRYRMPETSGLKITVHAGDNRFDIEMVP